MAEYTDNELAAIRANRISNLEARAVVLAHFVDELTEHVQFAARKYGNQPQAVLLDELQIQLRAMNVALVSADKQARLDAALAIATLAFRCHYGD